MYVVLSALMMSTSLMMGNMISNMAMTTVSMVLCWLMSMKDAVKSNHFVVAVFMITLNWFHLDDKIPACRIHI